MKKGVLISGIISIIAYSIVALVFFIVGMIYLFVKGEAAADPGAISPEELTTVATAFLIVAGVFLLAVIFSAILIGKRNSQMSKGAGITLGVFGIIFGAAVPAIFFIIDSATTRS